MAEVLGLWGRPLDDGVLRSECEGFVIGRSQGITFYPGQAVLSTAIRDETWLMAPYPEDFFEEKSVSELGEGAPSKAPAGWHRQGRRSRLGKPRYGSNCEKYSRT